MICCVQYFVCPGPGPSLPISFAEGYNPHKCDMTATDGGDLTADIDVLASPVYSWI